MCICVCAYVCMCVCVCLCVRERGGERVSVFVCRGVRTCVWDWVCVNIQCVYVYGYMNVCI